MDQNHEDKMAQEMKNREEAKKQLEEKRLAIMDELSAETEKPYPPEIVERINQILNDAAASLPPVPVPAPKLEVDPEAVMERAQKQIHDALAQYPGLAPETADKIKGVVGSPPAEPAKEPWIEPAKA